MLFVHILEHESEVQAVLKLFPAFLEWSQSNSRARIELIKTRITPNGEMPGLTR